MLPEGLGSMRCLLQPQPYWGFFPVGTNRVSDRGGGHLSSSPMFLRPKLCPGLCFECHLEMCIWAHACEHELIFRENARGVLSGTLDMQAMVLTSQHRWFWNVTLWCETGSWDLYVRGAEVRKLKNTHHTTLKPTDPRELWDSQPGIVTCSISGMYAGILP